MKLTNVKDTLVRALKTALQSAGAYLSVQLINGIDITDKSAITALLIGTVGAILGALSNLHVGGAENV